MPTGDCAGPADTKCALLDLDTATDDFYGEEDWQHNKVNRADEDIKQELKEHREASLPTAKACPAQELRTTHGNFNRDNFWHIVCSLIIALRYTCAEEKNRMELKGIDNDRGSSRQQFRM